MENGTISPRFSKPPEIVKLPFSTAIMYTTAGKKIHKLEWQDTEYYGFIEEDILKLHKPDGKSYQWILSLQDINGEDYIVLPEVQRA